MGNSINNCSPTTELKLDDKLFKHRNRQCIHKVIKHVTDRDNYNYKHKKNIKVPFTNNCRLKKEYLRILDNHKDCTEFDHFDNDLHETYFNTQTQTPEQEYRITIGGRSHKKRSARSRKNRKRPN